METTSGNFRIGAYRPIYLWGGLGTIRMNRLKFMNQAVDEHAHLEVHRDLGAKRVLDDLYCNWVHLMYNWGFPPEIEQEDWEDFARGAEVYHRRGSKVFAYIQSSNCVYDGSFRHEDWYALDHRGHKILYYSGRYMTCLTHPQWVAHLEEIIRGAIERGADGIFFDNLWYGEMPISLLGAWLGAAGCFCERCQEMYFEASGNPIPKAIVPGDVTVNKYLRWRSDQVTGLIAHLSNFANKLRPGTTVSANDYDIIMRNTYLVYGQDPRKLAKIKNVTMVENFALPRWEGWDNGQLVNNALTILNSLPLIGDAHLSVLSYDAGIGFDPPYEPRRYQQGIGEAAACGASMTTKGTEYYYNEQHTTLIPAVFEPIHDAIGKYNRWLEAHQNLYSGVRKNVAPVGIFYPAEAIWLKWHQLAPVYMGVCQILLAGGIPWKVISSLEHLEYLKVLFIFGSEDLPSSSFPANISVIQVTELPGWGLKPVLQIARSPALRSSVETIAHSLLRAYMNYKTARVLFDWLGLQKLYTQTPLFRLPNRAQRQSLLATLPDVLHPRLYAPEPVLVDVWKQDDRLQVHLMNYASHPQIVQVDFGERVSASVLSPDEEKSEDLSGEVIKVPLDIYKVLLIND